MDCMDAKQFAKSCGKSVTGRGASDTEEFGREKREIREHRRSVGCDQQFASVIEEDLVGQSTATIHATGEYSAAGKQGNGVPFKKSGNLEQRLENNLHALSLETNMISQFACPEMHRDLSPSASSSTSSGIGSTRSSRSDSTPIPSSRASSTGDFNDSSGYRENSMPYIVECARRYQQEKQREWQCAQQRYADTVAAFFAARHATALQMYHQQKEFLAKYGCRPKECCEGASPESLAGIGTAAIYPNYLMMPCEVIERYLRYLESYYPQLAARSNVCQQSNCAGTATTCLTSVASMYHRDDRSFERDKLEPVQRFRARDESRTAEKQAQIGYSSPLHSAGTEESSREVSPFFSSISATGAMQRPEKPHFEVSTNQKPPKGSRQKRFPKGSQNKTASEEENRLKLEAGKLSRNDDVKVLEKAEDSLRGAEGSLRRNCTGVQEELRNCPQSDNGRPNASFSKNSNLLRNSQQDMSRTASVQNEKEPKRALQPALSNYGATASHGLLRCARQYRSSSQAKLCENWNKQGHCDAETTSHRYSGSSRWQKFGMCAQSSPHFGTLLPAGRDSCGFVNNSTPNGKTMDQVPKRTTVGGSRCDSYSQVLQRAISAEVTQNKENRVDFVANSATAADSEKLDSGRSSAEPNFLLPPTNDKAKGILWNETCSLEEANDLRGAAANFFEALPFRQSSPNGESGYHSEASSPPLPSHTDFDDANIGAQQYAGDASGSSAELSPSVLLQRGVGNQSIYPSAAKRSPRAYGYTSTSTRFEISKMDVLSEEIFHYHTTVTQSDAVLTKKLYLRDLLYYSIASLFPMCGLYIVGSSLNGFGTNTSDMDLCLMISNRELDQQTDAVVVLAMVQNAFTVTNWVIEQKLIVAKVPILRMKFGYPFENITVDLNCNNSVAIRNTHLLCYYSSFDWRVRPIVSVVKEWAKRRDMNDANRSSFTSYSLVLMVIHYLQCGVSPPLLPSLQRAYPKRFSQRVDVRTLNVSVPLEPLPKEVFEKNMTATLGELLIGFLEYYAFRFDYLHDAISVRLGRKTERALVAKQRSPYSRNNLNSIAQWNCICIEEPFTYSNTAHSVHNQMVFDAIRQAFVDGYRELEATRDLNAFLDAPPISVVTSSRLGSFSPVGLLSQTRTSPVTANGCNNAAAQRKTASPSFYDTDEKSKKSAPNCAGSKCSSVRSYSDYAEARANGDSADITAFTGKAVCAESLVSCNISLRPGSPRDESAATALAVQNEKNPASNEQGFVDSLPNLGKEAKDNSQHYANQEVGEKAIQAASKCVTEMNKHQSECMLRAQAASQQVAESPRKEESCSATNSRRRKGGKRRGRKSFGSSSTTYFLFGQQTHSVSHGKTI